MVSSSTKLNPLYLGQKDFAAAVAALGCGASLMSPKARLTNMAMLVRTSSMDMLSLWCQSPQM